MYVAGGRRAGELAGVGTAWGAAVAVWMLGLGLLPQLAQWLRVQPNEISLERPYLRHDIAFTRAAFDLADAQEQDRQLSGQLTLWDQRGSRVIRGNVLAIPIEDTPLYVEPIYLQADTAAYPELRLVIAMHGDTLSHAPSFTEALGGLMADEEPSRAEAPERRGMRAADVTLLQSAFDDYKRLLAEGRFADAGRALERLDREIQSIAAGPSAD